jgi:hypothetical protein
MNMEFTVGLRINTEAPQPPQQILPPPPPILPVAQQAPPVKDTANERLLWSMKWCAAILGMLMLALLMNDAFRETLHRIFPSLFG